jgi:hypothetical protein
LLASTLELFAFSSHFCFHLCSNPSLEFNAFSFMSSSSSLF